tara:strand:+ start:567 stop:1103 length:537 start_codon:yes stop_codon:yes gene_type:complete
MKIISGRYKGRIIQTIDDSSTRPMMGIAREGIFNSLQFSFKDSDVLDLFAGSGSMGIEALSRGANYVTFIDNSKECIEKIKYNLIDIDSNYSVLNLNVSNYLVENKSQFNVIFYDPPFSYESEIVNKDISQLSNILYEGGFIVIHRHSNSPSTVYPKDVELYKEKKYGQSKVLILRKK